MLGAKCVFGLQRICVNCSIADKNEQLLSASKFYATTAERNGRMPHCVPDHALDRAAQATAFSASSCGDRLCQSFCATSTRRAHRTVWVQHASPSSFVDLIEDLVKTGFGHHAIKHAVEPSVGVHTNLHQTRRETRRCCRCQSLATLLKRSQHGSCTRCWPTQHSLLLSRSRSTRSS